MREIYLLKKTLFIYLFIFGIAGIITAMFRKKEWGRHMGISIGVWFIIFIVFLFSSWAGPVTLGAVFLLISFMAIKEYLSLSDVWNIPSGFFSLFLLVLILYGALQNKSLFYLIPPLSVFLFSLISLSPHQINKKASRKSFAFIYWGWGLMHIVLIRRLPHGFGYTILLCSMIALNDNSAFYAGRLLGGKKLAPSISPGKTWTGFIAGFLMDFIVAFIFRFTVPHLSLSRLLLIPLVGGIIIPLGDLIESAMKRDFGVKDTGTAIPGHGGFMDRFDSWAFTFPVVYYLLVWMKGG